MSSQIRGHKGLLAGRRAYWFQQAFWEEPEGLDQKPVTLGLLLVPCVLGWTVHATLDPWTLETAASFKTSRGWFYHRDDLFAVAALAYHAWLVTRVESLVGHGTWLGFGFGFGFGSGLAFGFGFGFGFGLGLGLAPLYWSSSARPPGWSERKAVTS